MFNLNQQAGARLPDISLQLTELDGSRDEELELPLG